MADAVVEFLLNNLKELLLKHLDLISGVKDQVESLHRDLCLMKAFLKDSREKRNEFEYVKEVVRQITDVAYEAEDIIDQFVVNASLQRARSTMGKVFRVFDNASVLRNVAREIASIRIKVKEIYDNKMYGIVSMARGEPPRKRAREKRPPVVEETNVVGFDGEARTIIYRLTTGTDHLDVVPIVGMGGLGKTTLARKVYADQSIEFHFYLRAWVYLSQEYSRREVFQAILESLELVNDQIMNMSDDRLAEELCKHLKNNRYLIVIDDVWTKEAWDDIRMAFPNTTLGSRILLTSRNKEVAWHANPGSPPHDLRFLEDHESWELLCKKTFRNTSCNPELVELGKEIAKGCGGLPLAIVVVSGLLLKKEKEHGWWKRVAERVSTYVAKDPKQCMDTIIYLTI